MVSELDTCIATLYIPMYNIQLITLRRTNETKVSKNSEQLYIRATCVTFHPGYLCDVPSGLHV